MKILVARNDRLGDFMLIWPALAQLRLSMPDAEIHVLVSAYTADIAGECPYVDRVVDDPGEGGDDELAGRLTAERYDAAIALFSNMRNALLLRRARIPYRLAPATKLAQLLYTHRLKQWRSRSLKPEYLYNQDLIAHFLRQQDRVLADPPGPPYLTFPERDVQQARAELLSQYGAGSGSALIAVHPGSGGSAPTLSLPQQATLCRELRSAGGHHIVISAGPAELGRAKALSSLLDGAHAVHHSTGDLPSYARWLACCDLFIGGSTGPLHLAGALNLRTAGFYSRRGSATALRWRTINDPERRLDFSPPADAAEEDMSSIDVVGAADVISRHLLGAKG